MKSPVRDMVRELHCQRSGATERSMERREIELLRTVCTHAHTIETDRRTDSNFARD
jgi:hypothetical protein